MIVSWTLRLPATDISCLMSETLYSSARVNGEKLKEVLENVKIFLF